MSRTQYPPALPPLSSLTQEMMASAADHYKAERLADAERIYHQVLTIDANHADSLHWLGMIAYQKCLPEEAANLIRQAIAVNRRQPLFHSNLGIVLMAQGKHDLAISSLHRAIALKPDFADAYNNLGLALAAKGRLADAVYQYEYVLALNPDNADVHNNLGIALRDLGRLAEAIAHYERALELKPQSAEAFSNLGMALQAQGKLAAAVSCFERAVALKPKYADAHLNLAALLSAENKHDEAAAHYERALELKLHGVEAHIQLGIYLRAQGRPDEAIKQYERALALNPDMAEIHLYLGIALSDLGRTSEGIIQYQRALALKSAYPAAAYQLGLAQLQNANFGSGWQNFEHRWQLPGNGPPRTYAYPIWNGERLGAGRLFLWGEQSLADDIMFAGLLPDLLRKGIRCVLDCDPRLKPLFARSFPDVTVVSGYQLSQSPDLDIASHLPIGSLPRMFRPTSESFADATYPYLFANPAERKRLRTRYASARLVVGIAWHADNPKLNRSCSIGLRSLAPLFTRTDVKWVSLQYGNHAASEQQIESASAPILVDREVDQFSDLDLFASQISAMDLVITTDNSTAHMAGALGVPVWLLLPFAAEWRWLRSRPDSPWYPTMRLFRQPTPGDWLSVLCSLPYF